MAASQADHRKVDRCRRAFLDMDTKANGTVDDAELGAVWNSNIQPDFNVSIRDSFDAISSALLREIDESNRFVQKSAESTWI